MNILLVDDNIEDMQHVCDELRLDNHQVTQAHNYQILNDICKSGQVFDLIILDLMMPPTNGIPINESDSGYKSGVYLYDIFISKYYPKSPFVILSAMDQQTKIYKSIISRFRKLKSFAGAFSKPVDIDILMNTIQA